jgi:hypothetical protein
MAIDVRKDSRRLGFVRRDSLYLHQPRPLSLAMLCRFPNKTLVACADMQRTLIVL